MKKCTSTKRGISLIVLVITIIVMAILAGTVIITISNTNVINEASKTKIKSDLSSLQDMVGTYVANNYMTIDRKNEYKLSDYGITNKEYEDITYILNGRLYVDPSASSAVKEVARELNMLKGTISSDTGKVDLNDAKLTNIIISGNSTQDGTPTPDSPIEIKSVGEKTKNIFDPGQWETPVIQTGITIQYLKDEDCFLLNGTATTTNIHAQKRVNIPTEIGKKYTISTEYVSGSIDKSAATGSRYSVAYIGKSDDTTTNTNWLSPDLLNDNTVSSRTATCDMQYISSFWFYISEGVTFNNYKVKIQIEQSDAATEYEQYGYKIPVKISGKNLFDIHIDSQTNSTSVSTNITEAITISAVNNNVSVSSAIWRMSVKYKDGTLGYVGDNGYSAGVFPKTFKATEDNPIVEIGWRGTYITAGSYDVQIEYGNSATEYETYFEPIVTNIYLDEPLRKIGDYTDYIDISSKKVVRNIKEKILSKNDNLKVIGRGVFYTETSNIVKPASTQTLPLVMCSHYVGTEWAYTMPSSATKEGVCINSSSSLVGFYDSVNAISVEKFNTFLNSNKIKLYYALSSPVAQTINLPTISNPNGTLSVIIMTSVKPSNLQVEYK